MPIVTIEVTLRDIVTAEFGCATRCPIASALHRITGRIWSVEGSERWLEYRAGAYDAAGVLVVIDLPEAAWKFAARYDAHNHVDPFAFEVDLPDELAPRSSLTPESRPLTPVLP